MLAFLVKAWVSKLLDIKKDWREYLPYDYTSLMHYPADAFAKPNMTTITMKHSNKSIEDVMGKQVGFSTCDIYKMNFVYGCRQYTDHQREISCKEQNKRGQMVCPRRDNFRYCARAAKDTNLCWKEPGLFQFNCPVACNNCEGVCYDSPYDEKLCRQIAHDKDQGYKCRSQDSHDLHASG
uniref:Metalloendopeptidase n=1 Tax=Romanomermis culicivorax TaxID=13658 RepID=A0A915IUG2_ROMCU